MCSRLLYRCGEKIIMENDDAKLREENERRTVNSA